MHLRQPGFTISALGQYKSFKRQENQDIFIKTN